MDWSKVAGVVGSAAPFLGTLLGGPAGGAVGALVANALGVKNDPDSVIAAVAGNPDAYLKLQELQLENKVQLEQLAVTAESNRLAFEANKLAASNAQYTAEATDRDSARKLAATQPADYVRPAITFILLMGGLLMLVCTFFGVGSDILKDPLAAGTMGLIIGFWFNELKQATGFYFGMTKEGASQTREISKLAIAPTLANGTDNKDSKNGN